MPPEEIEIIGKIEKLWSGAANSKVLLGIGDDTAVIRPPRAGEEVLLTTDQVIENTHFVRRTHPPRALGHKILARGLSDIAAMGGRPVCFLLSLALPQWSVGAWLNAFLSGAYDLSQSTEIPLVGGDIARGERFAAAITVVGSAPAGKALTRAGARPGDVLYVSGQLGGSALGLARLRKLSGAARASRDNAVRRYLWPDPRLRLGVFLRAKMGATSAMDLSDGLAMDLARLTKASGVGAEIQAAQVPLFPGASLSQALHGGEDYELLFTLPKKVHPPRTFRKLPLTAIGRIRARPGIDLVSETGIQKLRPQGYEHFRG
jgi:thiamine-monophosphate kinase